MIIGETKIKIIDKGYKLSREIYITRFYPNNTGEILTSEGYKGFDPRAEVRPTIELDPEELQELANVLAENGFKPKEGFLEGKLVATEKHLEDMRKLVFKF